MGTHLFYLNLYKNIPYRKRVKYVSSIKNDFKNRLVLSKKGIKYL